MEIEVNYIETREEIVLEKFNNLLLSRGAIDKIRRA